MWSTVLHKRVNFHIISVHNEKDGVIRYEEKESNRTSVSELTGSKIIVQYWRKQKDPHYHITIQEHAVLQLEYVEL
jgi:hypothetical protein